MRIFKYRGGDKNIFNRDLDSLASDTFWAPTRETLNDPSEGFLSIEDMGNQLDGFINVLVPDISKIAQSRDNFNEALAHLLGQRDKVSVFSLSQSYRDELLWAHYAYSHQGFCIEYDLKKLVNSGADNWYAFPVEYVEQPPTLDILDLPTLHPKDGVKTFIKKMIGFKSTRWNYEKEMRIICHQSGSQRCDYRAIKAIYFGLRMPTQYQTTLMERLQGRGIKYHQMQLRENTYSLTTVEIEDKFANAPKYIPKLAPIENYAIDPEALNEKWKSFADYMPKVAEIARRLPYAKSVEMIEVSYDKSSETEPVFFAKVLRQDVHVQRSVYYTLSEIEKEYAAISDRI
ncbi:MAG: DUF2971 domain-containing protein [Tunicatimonas sp.]